MDAVPLHLREANEFVAEYHRTTSPRSVAKVAVDAALDGKLVGVASAGRGYEKVITYTLAEKSGASLRAVGAQVVGQVEPKEWSVSSRPRESQAVYGEAKVKWNL